MKTCAAGQQAEPAKPRRANHKVPPTRSAGGLCVVSILIILIFTMAFPYYSRLLEGTLDWRKSLIVNVQAKPLLALGF